MTDYTIGLIKNLSNPSKDFPSLPRWQRKKMDRDHLSKVCIITKIAKLVDRTDNFDDMVDAPLQFVEDVYAPETRLLIDAIMQDIPAEYHDLMVLLRARLLQSIDRTLYKCRLLNAKS